MPLEVPDDARPSAVLLYLPGRRAAPSEGIGFGAILAWVLLVGTTLGWGSQVLDSPWWLALALFYPVLMPLLFAHGRRHDTRLMRFAAATGMRLACADTLRDGDLVTLPGQTVMLPIEVGTGQSWRVHHPGHAAVRALPRSPHVEVWVLPTGSERHRETVMAALEQLRGSAPTRSSRGLVIPAAARPTA